MKKRIIIFFIGVLFFTVNVNGEEKWNLKKDEAGIKIFLKDVPGSGIKEFKGIMYLKGIKLTTFLALLNDFQAAPRWMHECIEGQLIKKINDKEWITYTALKAPWPVSNRDGVVYSIVTQDPNSLELRVQLFAKPDYVAKRKDRVRMPSMKGYWLFKPLKGGTVMVVYQMHSEPGGSIPDWLANSSVVDIPFNTLKNMREIVKEKKYRDAVINLVKEYVP